MRKIITLLITSFLLMNCEGEESAIQSYNGGQTYNISTLTELNYIYPNNPHFQPYNIKFNNYY